jgi:hypothetical protein
MYSRDISKYLRTFGTIRRSLGNKAETESYICCRSSVWMWKFGYDKQRTQQDQSVEMHNGLKNLTPGEMARNETVRERPW